MNAYQADIDHLGRALGEAYASSPRGEKVTALHLFGIVHADEMSGLSRYELEQVAVAAGLTPSFATELRKMVKLSRYVVAREPGESSAPRQPSVFQRLARPFPVGFKFDRDEANAR